jgi:hypothetical protein
MLFIAEVRHSSFPLDEVLSLLANEQKQVESHGT